MTRQKVMKVGVDLRSLGKVRKMGVEQHLLHSIAPAEAFGKSDNRPISFVMILLLRRSCGKNEKDNVQQT
jgi:hypothetical protein